MENSEVITGENSSAKIIQAKYRKAPLPTAEELKEYDGAVPGLSKIIISEFQKQGAHRRTMEKLLVIGQIYIGPIISLAVIMSTLWMGYTLLMHDKPVSGLFIALAPLAAVGSLFVWNETKQKASNEKSGDSPR